MVECYKPASVWTVMTKIHQLYIYFSYNLVFWHSNYPIIWINHKLKTKHRHLPAVIYLLFQQKTEAQKVLVFFQILRNEFISINIINNIKIFHPAVQGLKYDRVWTCWATADPLPRPRLHLTLSSQSGLHMLLMVKPSQHQLLLLKPLCLSNHPRVQSLSLPTRPSDGVPKLGRLHPERQSNPRRVHPWTWHMIYLTFVFSCCCCFLY